MPASSRLPRLGKRGGGWVAIQTVLLVLIGLSALLPVYWPDALAGTLVVLGLVLIVTAVLAFAVAGVALLVARAATFFPRPRDDAKLTQHGAYRVVRHPLYAAVLLVALGWSLALSPLGLIPTALLAAAFDLKARLEEAWLVERHPEYAAYRERTRWRFLPGFY